VSKTKLIKIVEVGPRDGLQNETAIVPLATKIELINRLSQTGLQTIEAGSFVSPKWAPQMADSADVMRQIIRQQDITYSALIPNLQGYQRARSAGADEVAIFIATSEGFSQKNLNCSIAKSLQRIEPILAAAKQDSRPVRGYISCITHCPYDGAIEPNAVADLAKTLTDMGCREISLGDTIGKATPKDITVMLEAVLKQVPTSRLAGHFHDTSNNALANVEASLALGIATFDASIAGLGGCPYAPGAAGNLDTLNLVQFLHQQGYETGVNFEALKRVANFVQKQIISART
jgi:hydroxymethylglutaryl-CoA lyase